MAAKQKRNTRVQVTIDEETNEILEELYRLTGTPKATTIGEFVAGIKPHLRMSVDLLKKIKANEMEMYISISFAFIFLSKSTDILR